MRKQYPFKSERNTSQSRDLDAGDTQVYFLARDVGVKGLTFKIGRQDVEEPREWLFDEYLDAIRVYYYGHLPVVAEAAVFHAVAPLKDKIETWTDIFGQLRWHFDKHSRARAYFLLRRDSDETRNREPVWWGAGYYGNAGKMIRAWTDLAIMRGEDKGETLQAYGIDLGAIITAADIRFSPSITLSYALGSGDKSGGDQIDNNFRQTGYEDNVDNFGGIPTLRYYGEILDPELNNIKIFTAAVGFRLLNNSSIEAIYHSYRQHHPDDKLRGDLIDPPARPNGMSDDIGWEIDLIIGIRNLWERVSLSWVFGIFKPGDTFSPFLESAIMNRLNLKIDL
jgi:alginate production protein